mmetsp:Transcript_109244/g.209991  ORF Transcript_109244/g.209991 Transcript_109244/m.209991 type:complete len:1137 (+) Transcript_109244:90-3500(+)
MASMSDVNDENVQPERPNVVNFQPNDKDRLRFGFKKRPTGTAPAADPGLRQPGPAPALAHSPVPSLRSAVAELQTVRQLTPRSQRPTTPRSQRPSLAPPPSVDLLALHDKHLGDSEDLTAMLKRNPTSSKYEFKERMAELEKINKEFKTALSDVSKRSKLLREGLAPAQDEVNAWLQDSRNALHDEQRKAESEQESLRQRGKQDLEALRQQLLQEQANFRSRAEKAEGKLQKVTMEARDSQSRLRQALELLQQNMRDTQEFQHKLQSEHSQQIQKLQACLSSLEQDLARAHQDHGEKHQQNQARISALQQELAGAHGTHNQKHSLNMSRIMELERALEEQEQQLLARDKALREAAQRQREQVDQMQAEKQRIHTLELDHSQQLQKLHSEHSDQLDLEHQRVQKLESDHGEQLKKLRSEQCEKLLLEQQKTQKMEHDHSQQMQRLKSDHSEALALEQQRVQKLEHEHHQQIQKLQVEHNEQLQVEQERAQRQEREHGEQLQQTQRDHSEQQHADQQRIQQLESSHLERVQRLEREHGERLQQIQHDHSEQQRLEQNHAEEVQLERQRYEQSQADLAASRQTNAELRAALHSVESEREVERTLLEVALAAGGDIAKQLGMEDAAQFRASFKAKLQRRLAEVEEKAKEERTDAAKLTGALEKEEEEANTCVCLWTRCQELEDKLKRANQEMQDVRRQAEEATRALEVQQTQNEGLRSMHEDELADVQEKVHAQLDALRADHEAALGARIADFDAQRDAERAATDQNVKALEDRCIAAKAKARDAQWRFLAEAVLVQESWECRDELWVQVKIVVSQWRRQVRWQEGDQKRLEAQEEELERLTAEIEREHEQHKKVQHDLHILQEVFQSREPELRRLQGMEAEYERQIWQLSDRMDGGHANPKQKIKLFQQIKDENNQLKEELKKKEKDIKKMEMELRKAHFYEAETSVLSEASAASGRTRATTPGAQRHQTAVTTPERKTPAATGSRTPGRTSHREHEREVLAGLADDRPGALQREKAEAQRQARANRRAADNAVQQYQHLKDIVETVLVTRGSRPEREGTCVSDCGTDQALFQRLRELMPPKKPEAPGSVTEGCSSGALADPKTPPKKQSAKVPSGSPSPPSDSPSPDEGLRLIEDLNV